MKLWVHRQHGSAGCRGVRTERDRGRPRRRDQPIGQLVSYGAGSQSSNWGWVDSEPSSGFAKRATHTLCGGRPSTQRDYLELADAVPMQPILTSFRDTPRSCQSRQACLVNLRCISTAPAGCWLHSTTATVTASRLPPTAPNRHLPRPTTSHCLPVGQPRTSPRRSSTPLAKAATARFDSDSLCTAWNRNPSGERRFLLACWATRHTASRRRPRRPRGSLDFSCRLGLTSGSPDSSPGRSSRAPHWGWAGFGCCSRRRIPVITPERRRIRRSHPRGRCRYGDRQTLC